MLAQASNLNQGDWAIMFVDKDAYQEAIQRLLDHNEAQDNLIRAKDAIIAALTQDRDNWRSRALEDAWPPEWIVASELHELLQAKDAQIERLQLLMDAVTPQGMNLKATAKLWRRMADHPSRMPEAIDGMVEQVANALAAIKEATECS